MKGLEWVEYTGDNKWYWKSVEKKAAELKSNGCTDVPDFYLRSCL